MIFLAVFATCHSLNVTKKVDMLKMLANLSVVWLIVSTFYHEKLLISSAAPPPTASGDIRPVNYNPLRPPKKGDSPVKVKVNIHVNTLISVEEFEQVNCNSLN